MQAMLNSLIEMCNVSILGWMTGGTALGLLFGAIPGLTGSLAVIMLIPFTYSMETVTGMATLIGAYVGGISGGLASAILLNMPGTPSSVATAFDGFPLAQQGKAGKALGVGVVCSFFGTLLGWICLITMTPLLAKIALAFGHFEYVAAILFGFTAVVTLSGRSVFKGIVAGLFGLALMTIGFDPYTGVERSTFGLNVFTNGIQFLPALIGFLVLSEIFIQIEDIHQRFIIPKQKISDVYMTFREIRDSGWNIIRSAVIGVAIGILPGIGGSFANLVCYDQAKKASKDPDSFGKGNIQGIVAAETGNNATIGGALIPMIAVGIPGDGVTAALMGGLMIKGLSPGPMFTIQHPDVMYSMFNTLLISSFIMLIFMLGIGVRVFPKVLRLPKHIILPLVLIMALAGSYNTSISVKDVWVSVFMGFVGYFFNKFGFPKVPVIIAMVLGTSFEQQLRMGLKNYDGTFIPMFTRPYSLLFVIITLLTIVLAITRPARKRRTDAKLAQGKSM
jgi:putative tricarboxylic transport membrane protein